MPRSRPGHVRARFPGRRTPRASPEIDGLSARAMSEISLLERTRTYLWPGEVSRAVRLWRDHVRRPEREQWREYERDDGHWDCCGDPFEARVLLDTVTRALSRPSARELRRVLARIDGRG